MGTGEADDQVVTIMGVGATPCEGRRGAAHAGVDEAGALFGCLAGQDIRRLSFRDRRLRRRVGRALGSSAEIDIVFAASTTDPPPGVSSTCGAPSRRVVVVVDARGAVAVCHRSLWPPAIVVDRFAAGGDEIGAISVSPGCSFIDLGGVRHRVANRWMYELFRLQRTWTAADDTVATGSRAIGE
jgi:hypothetical protein